MFEFGDTFMNILNYTWPMIFIFSVILVSIRIAYVCLHNEKIILYRELITLFSIIYLLLLFLCGDFSRCFLVFF